MKIAVQKAVTVCQAVILAAGLVFSGCSDWLNNEKEPEITIDPNEPLRIIIEEENGLYGIIDFVKVFGFDNMHFEENDGNLIEFSLIKHYYSHNRLYTYDLYLTEIVSDEKLIKISDVIDNGKLSNPAAKVVCLQYFRAYNEESNCIGYFEWGLFNQDDEIGIITQFWYADSEVTYIADDGNLILSLHKGWNVVYEEDDIYYKDLYDKGYRLKWRFTEL